MLGMITLNAKPNVPLQILEAASMAAQQLPVHIEQSLSMTRKSPWGDSLTSLTGEVDKFLNLSHEMKAALHAQNPDGNKTRILASAKTSPLCIFNGVKCFC